MNTRYIYDFLNRYESFLKDHFREESGTNFILSMLLLRFASLEFEKEYMTVKAEEPGCEEWEQTYEERGSLYFPPDLRWQRLGKQEGENLRAGLCSAMQLMDKPGSKYRDLVYPKSVFGEWDGREIQAVFDMMGECFLEGEGEEDPDLPGIFEAVFEYIVSRHTKETGGWNTPRQIAALMVDLLDPAGGTVYDPCCGSGGMLLCAADHMKKESREFELYGQEADEDAWKAARISLLIRGREAWLGKIPADSIRQDIHEGLKADYVLGNPPFHGYGWSEPEWRSDRRWRYGVPAAKRGDFAWMQHMLYHLDENGRMGAIFSNGILDSRRNEDRRIRAALLQDDVLETVITLPSGMFYGAKVSVSLWIFSKNKKEICRNQLLLVDARKLGETQRGITALSASGQERILQAYRNYQNGTREDQPEFCRQVSARDIEEEEYSLAPERYIRLQPRNLPGWEELEAKERQLRTRLNELLNKNKITVKHIIND